MSHCFALFLARVKSLRIFWWCCFMWFHYSLKQLIWIRFLSHSLHFSLPAKLSCHLTILTIMRFRFSLHIYARHVNWSNDLTHNMVAHDRVVTSSHQITEVKQCRARLILGWMAGARVTTLAMSGDVWQASHIMTPLSTQQWWMPGGTKNELIVIGISCTKSAEFPTEEMRPYEREFQYQGCKLWSLLNSMGYQTVNIHIYIYIYICNMQLHKTLHHA